MSRRLITRREALRAGAASGGALAPAAMLSNDLIARALAAAPKCGTLTDIEHVVILIQENRSFDHYFGSYRGVRGFADPRVLKLTDGSGLSIFAQPGYPGGFNDDHLYPFHLDSYSGGECTNDIDHSWGPQHTYWDGGKLDGFVTGHPAADGSANGPLARGYYTRKDLSFHYALADAFTICDDYYCSVIGPTDPNRLYAMSAWLDPAGTQSPAGPDRLQRELADRAPDDPAAGLRGLRFDARHPVAHAADGAADGDLLPRHAHPAKLHGQPLEVLGSTGRVGVGTRHLGHRPQPVQDATGQPDSLGELLVDVDRVEVARGTRVAHGHIRIRSDLQLDRVALAQRHDSAPRTIWRQTPVHTVSPRWLRDSLTSS